MSGRLLAVQQELRRLGFRTSPGVEDFHIYTELFVNDVYRVEQIRDHLRREPVPEATVIVDLGANKNWFLHLLEEKIELGRTVPNVCYFRVEPQPISVTYRADSPVKMYHVNRAIVPDAEDQHQFLPFSYDAEFSAMAGSVNVANERIGSEVGGTVVNKKYAEYLIMLVTTVSATMAQINVETIGPRRLLDRITKELARLKVGRHRTLVKIDCEYQELTVVSDVLSYIAHNERWSDFLVVAETGAGGVFDASHRADFAVEEYMGRTGMPNEWLFEVPYMLVQPRERR